MIAGKDFPDLFEKDNYGLRHVTGHNMHDPESFITGRELSNGFTYENSKRKWRNHEDYIQAVSGGWSPLTIERLAPRVFTGSCARLNDPNWADDMKKLVHGEGMRVRIKWDERSGFDTYTFSSQIEIDAFLRGIHVGVDHFYPETIEVKNQGEWRTL